MKITNGHRKVTYTDGGNPRPIPFGKDRWSSSSHKAKKVL